MSRSTNQLVTSAKRYSTPTAFAGAAILGASMFLVHGDVHAAGATAPLDDSSVSALTALDRAMETVTSRVTPSIVNVEVTSRGGEDEGAQQGQQLPQGLPPGFEQFFGGGRMQRQQPQVEHGIGSGVIISPDGYIVTNNHVVAGATKIRVTLNDRRIFTGKVIGTDKLTDLAVIKIEASGLQPIAWGDSTKLIPGQTVLAFGSPFGSLRFSVTRGIVSALNRANQFENDPRKPGDLIQTDAAINPGNSGGALVDSRGELIGINVGIMTSSGSFAGAGFAIPSQTVQATTKQLIAHGKVEHGYIGISMNDVTPENAHFFNLQRADGAIVAQVTPESPAARGGLKSGDVIAKLDGREIPNSSALQVAISQMQPGTKLSLGVIREGRQETVNVTVGSYKPNGSQVAQNDGDEEQPGGQKANSGKLGLAVSDLNQDLRQQINAPDQLHGAVVQSVRPESPADEAGIQPGDVILEVNRSPVQTASQFAGQAHQAPAGKELLLLVWSKGNASYRTLRPDGDGQNG